MRFHLCNACGAKISRISANGVVVYNSQMRQIHLVFDHLSRPRFDESLKSDHPEYGKPIGYEKQRLHIPVCLNCYKDVGNINYDKVKLILKNDLTFRRLTSNPAMPVKLAGYGVDENVFAGQTVQKVDREGLQRIDREAALKRANKEGGK